jgi:hypothetical protein
MDLLRWRPSSRVERLRASHTYGLVLALIAVTYLVIVAAPDRSWARSLLLVIEVLTLALALWTSGFRWLRPATVLAAGTIVVVIVQLLVGGATIAGLSALLDVLLVTATVVVIGLGVFDQGEINRKSVTGAVCIYLFLGILFTYVYGAEASLGSGPFFAQGTDGTPGIRIYFSYVTLATLGYGDYTAAGEPGRTSSIVEALLGQLYLVTVIALLVSRFGQPARRAAE